MLKSESLTLKNPELAGINGASSVFALDIGQRKRDLQRYFQFSLLLLSAGTIYPLIYLRQNFENTVLEAFQVTSSELSGLYSTLGVIYCLSYVPSGWLADKFQPRLLVSFSLAVVGGLGLWFSSYPSLHALRFIFIGWGLAAGLCFWASLIKGVKLLATANEQGRFFGILDGGRGLVEASLATAALSIFAYMSRQGDLAQSALRPVILLYALSCLAIAALIFFFLDSGKKLHEQELDPNDVGIQSSFVQDLKALLFMPQIWLLSAIIFTGYQLFWATYSFSAFLQDGYGMTAITAGAFTVAKQWTRPIGGIGAGFLGDKFPREQIIIITYFLASAGFLCLANLPQLVSPSFLFCMIVLIGMLTYSIRGLYWALLDSCHLPPRLTGLAIGLVSLIGYLPDVILPMINSAIFNRYPGAASYKIYFTYIAVSGILGALLTAYFQKLTVAWQTSAPNTSSRLI